MTKERTFQSKVIKWAKSEGYDCIKIPSSVQFGIPDLQVWHKQKQIRVETKTDAGRVRDSQRGWKERHPDETVLYTRPSDFEEHKLIIKEILR